MHDQLTGAPESGSVSRGLTRPVGRRGLGVSISAPGRFLEHGLRDVLRYAVWAEELGFSTITIGEHVVVGADVTARGSDRWYTQGQLWPDPLVTLGAVAAVTEHVRLGTNIYIAPLRPAVAVAKMAATVDALSGGRFNFGLALAGTSPSSRRSAYRSGAASPDWRTPCAPARACGRSRPPRSTPRRSASTTCGAC